MRDLVWDGEEAQMVTEMDRGDELKSDETVVYRGGVIRGMKDGMH